MSSSEAKLIAVGKRRLMLYKAIQDFPDNQRIRSTYLHTYTPELIQLAAQDGVYFGYHRNDELFALELDTELRQKGVNVWMDTIDIDPDEDWTYAVETALNRSGVMIMVLSPYAVDDLQIQREATIFLELGKVVIPVIHEPCNYEAYDLMVEPIDFSENFKMGLQLLSRQLTSPSTANA